jgi:hypothetical protein
MDYVGIVAQVERCHELLTNPCNASFQDMVALETANPIIVPMGTDAFAIAKELRGWSNKECKRRGVSMSDTFATAAPNLRWAVLKMGRNDYEPVYLRNG